MSILILIFWAVLMAAAVFMALEVIKAGKGHPSKRRYSKPPSRKNRPATRRIPQQSPLWRQLLLKVKGDAPTAERLIDHLQLKHPGQTDRWYLEKAIHDIERDNRS